MNFLRTLQALRGQFKVQYAQYWQDQMMEEIIRANAGAGVLTIGNILAVKTNVILEDQTVIPGMNIVTNDGDVYYAQSICAETPTDDFDGGSSGLRQGSAATTPTKTDTDVTTFLSGTGLALDGTYEQTNDSDGDNTGAGTDIVTWRYSYGTGDGNANGIAEGAIVDDITTPTAALTHFLYAASFNKTSSDTLKVFVNHTVNGV